MRIEEEQFETNAGVELFAISVTGEGDMSDDGGYTFETTTHTAELTTEQAVILIEELKEFITNKLVMT